MCNCEGFTLPPRVGRGVKADSRAATGTLLFHEVYSDISLNCHQICTSSHADHFVSRLAYVSGQCVVSAYHTCHSMSLQAFLVWVGCECVFFSSFSDLLPSLHCYRLKRASGLYAAANSMYPIYQGCSSKLAFCLV